MYYPQAPQPYFRQGPPTVVVGAGGGMMVVPGAPQLMAPHYQQHQVQVQANQMIRANTAEQEVFQTLNKIGADAENMFKDLREYPGTVLWDRKERTIKLLTEMELSLDKVINSLNLATKHLAAQPAFQAHLSSTCNVIHKLIQGMRDAVGGCCMMGTCQSCCDGFWASFCCYRCCWLGCTCLGEAYMHNKRIEKIAEAIAKKIEQCQTNFSLSLNLTGTVALGGNAGATVTLNDTKQVHIESQLPDTRVNVDGMTVSTGGAMPAPPYQSYQ